jgi:hypothetical protein
MIQGTCRMGRRPAGMDRRQDKIAKKIKDSTEDRQSVQGDARERRGTNNMQAEDR